MKAEIHGKRRKVKLQITHVVSAASMLMLSAVTVIFVLRFFAFGCRMSGHSMEPAIPDRALVLINRSGGTFGKLDRFDIVAFYDADGAVHVKRVAGMPNETVKIADGRVLIDGAVLNEEGMPEWNMLSAGAAQDGIVLGEDEYFLLGDNPVCSEDSRFGIGAVKRKDIIGKAWISWESLLSVRLFLR